MQPAGGHEHDLIARLELLPEDRRAALGHYAHSGTRELDVPLIEQPGQ